MFLFSVNPLANFIIISMNLHLWKFRKSAESLFYMGEFWTPFAAYHNRISYAKPYLYLWWSRYLWHFKSNLWLLRYCIDQDFMLYKYSWKSLTFPLHKFCKTIRLSHALKATDTTTLNIVLQYVQLANPELSEHIMLLRADLSSPHTTSTAQLVATLHEKLFVGWVKWGDTTWETVCRVSEMRGTIHEKLFVGWVK